MVAAVRDVVCRQNAHYSDDDVWEFEEPGSSDRSEYVADGGMPVGEERISFSPSSVT